jgi:hypothetical protein
MACLYVGRLKANTTEFGMLGNTRREIHLYDENKAFKTALLSGSKQTRKLARSHCKVFLPLPVAIKSDHQQEDTINTSDYLEHRRPNKHTKPDAR